MRQSPIGRARVLLTTAVVAASTAGLAALPSAASATSGGCTPASSGFVWRGLSGAYTCIDVYGHRRWVDSVQGSWGGVGTVCNYRFRVRFRDIHGRAYQTNYSRTHVGCRWAYDTRIFVYKSYKRTGMVCVQVQENGRNVGHAACESIF